MKTAVYYSNRDIRIEERPMPVIGPDELLVRVEAAGICGSDVMEWYRKDKVPLVLGHEIAGVIDQAGTNIKAYKKGDRVVCAHHVPCGECHYCLSGHETVCDTLRRTNFDPGGFSEYLRLAAINVGKGTWIIPDNVSFDEATFVEPLACVLRGQRLCGGVKGKCVLVVGSGIAGCLHIALSRQSGARLIVATDVSSYRLSSAKRFGADKSVNAADYTPDMLRQLNQGRLADLVIVSTGNTQAIQQAVESVERAGTVLFFAPTDKDVKIPMPFNRLFWRTEIGIVSSYAGSPADYKQALDLIAAGGLDINSMITHRLSLNQIAAGFELVAGANESLKVIVYPYS